MTHDISLTVISDIETFTTSD